MTCTDADDCACDGDVRTSTWRALHAERSTAPTIHARATRLFMILTPGSIGMSVPEKSARNEERGQTPANNVHPNTGNSQPCIRTSGSGPFGFCAPNVPTRNGLAYNAGGFSSRQPMVRRASTHESQADDAHRFISSLVRSDRSGRRLARWPLRRQSRSRPAQAQQPSAAALSSRGNAVIRDSVRRVLDRALADSAFPGAIAVVGTRDARHRAVRRRPSGLGAESGAGRSHAVGSRVAHESRRPDERRSCSSSRKGRIDLDAPRPAIHPDLDRAEQGARHDSTSA